MLKKILTAFQGIRAEIQSFWKAIIPASRYRREWLLDVMKIWRWVVGLFAAEYFLFKILSIFKVI